MLNCRRMAFEETKNSVVRLLSYAALVIVLALTVGVASVFLPYYWYFNTDRFDSPRKQARAQERVDSDTSDRARRRFFVGSSIGAIIGVGTIAGYRIRHGKP